MFIFLIMERSTAQSLVPIDTTQNTKPLGLAADIFIYDKTPDNVEYDTLIGSVKITQDSFFLYSDLAYVKDKSIVEAYDEVVILQGDSIEIFADSLVYNDYEQRANLYGEVIFSNAKQELHTTSADYDFINKIAKYTDGATLFNEGQTLISQKGTYDIDAEQAFFQEKVSIRDSSSLLLTDSLRYHLAEERAQFIAPTVIQSDSTRIYCEKGYFNYQDQKGLFYENLKITIGEREIFADFVEYFGDEGKYVLTGYPVVKEPSRLTKADTIVFYDAEERLELRGNGYIKDQKQIIQADQVNYNMKTEEYTTSGKAEVIDESGRQLIADQLYKGQDGSDVAESNVIMVDQNENVTLSADVLRSQPDGNSYSAYSEGRQALLLKEFEADTLLLKSDTLTYVETDSTQSYSGVGEVSFKKGTIVGKSGRLKYVPSDSSYSFRERAVIWSDSIQITGDTIDVLLKDEVIEAVVVEGNAFLIMQNGNGTHEQIKGEKIVVYFSTEDQIESVEIDKNVEMIYFLYEENELTGVNHTLCGGMTITFENDDIDVLKFHDKPKSTFSKGEGIVPEDHNLQGFEWKGEARPDNAFFLK